MPDLGYEPIDMGDGRRLERFGEVVVDRPAPAAADPRCDPMAWRRATARFDAGEGEGGWRSTSPLPDPWHLRIDGLELELRAASGGQVGVFPEQEGIWTDASGRVVALRAVEPREGEPSDDSVAPRVLSLFGYTGAATLACARSGAEVVHVDASRTAVAWARRNAELSGLAGARIRWITEDARTFVAREARRGRRYEVVVLDPPSYGHGPEGRDWRIERDLEPLLASLVSLVEPAGFVVLTAHTLRYSPERLRSLLGALGGGTVRGGPLGLVATSGARLPLGAWATWTGG